MKRLLWCLVFLFIVISSSALATESRLVKLRILDEGKPQAGVKVLVNYADAVRTCGTTLTLTTDAAGLVQFALADEVFWVTVPSLNPGIVGREIKVPAGAPRAVRWDLKPREWKREVQP
jgi:hypothetical protein